MSKTFEWVFGTLAILTMVAIPLEIWPVLWIWGGALLALLVIGAFTA